MDFTEKVILTNMCMLMQGEKVLVQDRVDSRWKGVAFPGGHVEKGESLVDAVVREFYEETGLTIGKPTLCGIKNWMLDDGTRYIVFLYAADSHTGALRASEEGNVYWVDKKELPALALAPDMEATLRVFNEDFSECFYHDEDGEWVRKLQ